MKAPGAIGDAEGRFPAPTSLRGWLLVGLPDGATMLGHCGIDQTTTARYIQWDETPLWKEQGCVWLVPPVYDVICAGAWKKEGKEDMGFQKVRMAAPHKGFAGPTPIVVRPSYILDLTYVEELHRELLDMVVAAERIKTRIRASEAGILVATQ